MRLEPSPSLCASGWGSSSLSSMVRMRILSTSASRGRPSSSTSHFRSLRMGSVLAESKRLRKVPKTLRSRRHATLIWWTASGDIRPDQWVESTHQCELADQVRMEDLGARRVLGRPASSLVVDVGLRLDLPDSAAHAPCLGVGTCADGMGLGPLLPGRRAGDRRPGRRQSSHSGCTCREIRTFAAPSRSRDPAHAGVEAKAWARGSRHRDRSLMVTVRSEDSRTRPPAGCLLARVAGSRRTMPGLSRLPSEPTARQHMRTRWADGSCQTPHIQRWSADDAHTTLMWARWEVQP